MDCTELAHGILVRGRRTLFNVFRPWIAPPEGSKGCATAVGWERSAQLIQAGNLEEKSSDVREISGEGRIVRLTRFNGLEAPWTSACPFFLVLQGFKLGSRSCFLLWGRGGGRATSCGEPEHRGGGTAPGRPAELARVLRGAGCLVWGRASPACAVVDPGRAVPEHLHQPGGRAGAGQLAKLVGAGLGWKVYDEELVEAIAHRMGSPIEEVRSLDELAPSMVQDWLLPLREEYYAPQEAYLDHLAKLIEAIGGAGNPCSSDAGPASCCRGTPR